ncbi:tyrosinase family protein [Moorena sp. SIO4G3]|uniref:tyrosinase family protein n=1 Tax=Moorena sp. SIO4G3 TaxID=2607821 RepID=UPI00142B73A4|nr:tyrosinase family protein [Moorena sp. SIO4G3]NEO80604.1 tyrosinase family protein [Moorena sp. SIO4G3]
MTDNKDLTGLSRRSFLVGTGSILLASTLPIGQASAQTTTYIRRNLSDPSAPLKSYKKAIKAMLELPPSDPRNWYRNAFIHLLDCPHGNWWFLPWHRGYLGWFEKTCRKLSGDPDFALPYWDWTQERYIPKKFFKGVLNPSHEAFISSYSTFKAEFENPMSDFWNSLTDNQLCQQKLRGYFSIDDVWQAIENPEAPMFYPSDAARRITQENPYLDCETQTAVSLETIKSALAPSNFIDFGSTVARYHSQTTGFAILEGQPHNLVHNNIGGFMGNFLSPVDPIFFMHHCNIDRLWDVWTRKQEKLSLPTLPEGEELAKWQAESFLFFIDDKGNEVQANTAGDYANICDFNYVYQPGSGEEVVSAHKKVKTYVKGVSALKPVSGEVIGRSLKFKQLSKSNVNLPKEILRTAVGEIDGSNLVAEITIQPPANARDVRFNVLVNSPKGQDNIELDNTNFVGALEFFGTPHHRDPVTFTIPLTRALKALAKTNKLDLDQDQLLEVDIVPNRKTISRDSLKATFESVATFESLTIKTF